ncbi:MAG: protein-L-isoaspartate(D-aspartate) O-methyltransferase [Alphaproteobacteria bacterium]|nr:protein-L-isoaspartate(D-aspartate) O-methyltransferase [Alphaproteobacteria bacterium]MBN9569427.1 protein-L-isoaspartate(D-aspartate) O-methyltransferase [Alphaproteobacteria bacterium]
MTDPRAIQLVMALRKQGITDMRVLNAMERTPRDLFVEEAFGSSAYQDSALPIACGQTISQPYIVAFMTQALAVGEKMRVLEIGTGSGYQSAVLAPLCRKIYTIERHRPLLKAAEARFKALKLDNIVTKLGDGYKGWPEQAPFDRIVVTAAFPQVPESLIAQLKPGGIMIVPVGEQRPGESISQLLTKIIRTETGVKREALIPVMFVPMVPGLPREPQKADERERKI